MCASAGFGMNSRARLECLRSRVSLLALAGRFTSMRHYGRAEHVGLCPLHSESHPSFFVNTEAGRFHCFGCEAGGDVFRFLEILLACDFRKSVRQAARLASGKPLSLPAVGLVSLPYRCRGVQGGRRPPASDRQEGLRAARVAHRLAVEVGAARALLEREAALPPCMRTAN